MSAVCPGDLGGTMWPFDRKKPLQADQIERAFAKYTKKAELDGAHRSNSTSLEPRRIQFVLIQIRDDVLADLPARLSRAMEVAMEHGGIIESVTSSLLLVMCVRPTDGATEPDAARWALVDAVLRDLGSDAKILHGEADTLYGIFGAARAFRHGPLFAGFASTLATLQAVPFGRSAEIAQPSSQ